MALSMSEDAMQPKFPASTGANCRQLAPTGSNTPLRQEQIQMFASDTVTLSRAFKIIDILGSVQPSKDEGRKIV